MEELLNTEAQNYIKDCLKVESNLRPLTGDAGTRQYFKIENQSTDNNILCAYKKDELTSFDNFLNVGSLFSRHNIKTPLVLHTNKDQGFMILEDLGDLTLEDVFKETKDEVLYFKALDEIIKIQGLGFEDDSVAHTYAFDVEKFNWELNFAVKHLSQLYKLNTKDLNTSLLEKEFTLLSQKLFSLKQVITHRDYHSRNLIYSKGEIFIIDFQDARLGNPFYDLTSLIEDTYTDLSENLKHKLKTYYIEKSDLNFEDDFNKNYNLQALQRTFKACGSFAYLQNDIGTGRYLQYLKPSLRNLKNYFKEVKEFPQFEKFISLCQKEEGK